MQDKEKPKIKVLAVDDEEDARKLIKAILGSIYEIQLAESAQDGISKSDEFKPQIVLTDLKMPGENGMSLLEAIRAKDPSALVIIMTGYADKATAIEAIKKGAFDFLEKPFSPDELRAAIGRAAEKVKLKEDLRIAEIKAFDNARLAALGEMAAGVAHEVNNPVTIIQGYARVLKKLAGGVTLDKNKVLEIAEIIDKTSVRIAKIITSLRKLARPDTKEFSLISVREIIDDTIGLCGERFKNSGVQLTIPEISSNLVLQCNQLQLSQVILNLLNNAYHEVSKKDEGGWIRISAKDEGDQVEIAVTDSGHGIPAELHDKIFQVFYTTKDVGEGTGLGLSLSRQMVEHHNGTLTIDKDSPNTSFVIRIPKSAA